MSKATQTAQKTASEQAVMQALAAAPQATAAQVAGTAGLGRSTTSRLLARLHRSGEVRHSEGGRDGARRLPDRWTLASGDQPAQATADTAATAAGDRRLGPGQLDGLVLTYLREHPDSAPHGPTTVAKALRRSSGAVANCLARLTKAKQVRQVSDHPRRYSLPA